MTSSTPARQALAAALACALIALSACGIGGRFRPAPGEAGPPAAAATQKVAVIVPMAGEDGGIGTSIGNAARLALLDSGTPNIELSVYDSTVAGAAAATARAIGEGNRLILGPLLAAEVRAAAPVARAARVPLIAFSNDESVAGDGVYLLGFTPRQSIERTVAFARSRGLQRFGGLIPDGIYGDRALAALQATVAKAGGSLGRVQRFGRTAASVRTAANSLNASPHVDALLIADGGRIASQAAAQLKPGARLFGTELWANDRSLGGTARLRGAWFAAAPDARFNQLVARYQARYGKTPYRLGSLGYDAVLLTVRAVRSWPRGRPFPERLLYDREGFAGVDGIFRFGRDGVAERSLEVREVTAAGSRVVAPAATAFTN